MMTIFCVSSSITTSVPLKSKPGTINSNRWVHLEWSPSTYTLRRQTLSLDPTYKFNPKNCCISVLTSVPILAPDSCLRTHLIVNPSVFHFLWILQVSWSSWSILIPEFGTFLSRHFFSLVLVNYSVFLVFFPLFTSTSKLKLYIPTRISGNSGKICFILNTNTGCYRIPFDRTVENF